MLGQTLGLGGKRVLQSGGQRQSVLIGLLTGLLPQPTREFDQRQWVADRLSENSATCVVLQVWSDHIDQFARGHIAQRLDTNLGKLRRS